MKNKDNVEKKVGQVWKGASGDVREVVAFRNGYIITWRYDSSVARAYPLDSPAFNTLISDPDQPWLPLPEGTKLKEYWEEGELIPEGTMFWHFMKKEWRRSNVIGQCPCDKDKYAVPNDYEFVKLVPNMTPAIEVDWNSIQGDTIEFDKLILQRPGTTPPVDEKPFEWLSSHEYPMAEAIKQLQEEVQKLKEEVQKLRDPVALQSTGEANCPKMKAVSTYAYAKMMGISRDTVMRLIHSGEIEYKKIGRQYRILIPESELVSGTITDR